MSITLIEFEKAGYQVDDVLPGRTYGSQVIHGHMVLDNGVTVRKTVWYPGIFDSIAWPDRVHEFKERFSVYSGVDGVGCHPAPPPGGAPRLVDYDGEEAWWMDFDTEHDAIHYARSMAAPQAVAAAPSP